MRIGLGEDIHHLKEGRALLLGGVAIPAPFGEDAHSDGDVLLHALADAIYGAIADRDIGDHFPDNDSKTEGMDSSRIVKDALRRAKEKGYRPTSLDSNIFLEKPKLSPYIDEIRKRIASLLSLEDEAVSIKAKTFEGLGPIGLGEAIRATCIIMMEEVTK